MKRIVAALALALAAPLPAAAQSDETCIAYMEADAAHKAVSVEFDNARRSAKKESNAALEKARKAYGEAGKEADSIKDEAAWDKALKKAAKAYEDAQRDISDKHYATVQSIESRRKKAIKAADDVRHGAYLEAYDGPTSNVPSVFVKLILADRERCRLRFGQ